MKIVFEAFATLTKSAAREGRDVAHQRQADLGRDFIGPPPAEPLFFELSGGAVDEQVQQRSLVGLNVVRRIDNGQVRKHQPAEVGLRGHSLVFARLELGDFQGRLQTRGAPTAVVLSAEAIKLGEQRVFLSRGGRAARLAVPIRIESSK